MKLYATVTNGGDSRPARKGANDFLRIELTAKNTRLGQIEVREDEAHGFIRIMYYDRAGTGSIVNVVPTAKT